MNWLNRLEVRFGHLAIPGLPALITGFNLLVFVLYKLDPTYFAFISFDRAAILHGEVWRLLTFLFIPSWGWFLPVPDWFGAFLYLVSIYLIGTGVERAMGAFKLTIYYALGMAGLAFAGLVFGGAEFTGLYANALLNISLLFAFAAYYPQAVFYLALVLPVQAVWIAWFTAALLLWSFLTRGWDYRISVIAALVNYFVFFGADLARAALHRKKVAERRLEFDRQVREGAGSTLHECSVCHRTEVSAPELEFRVGRDGQEYCLEHLPKPKVA